MQLYIHLGTNLEYFDLLNKWKLLSQWKQDRELASFFMQNFPWELAENISPQYEVNFMAIREIKKRFWPDYFNTIDWFMPICSSGSIKLLYFEWSKLCK